MQTRRINPGGSKAAASKLAVRVCLCVGVQLLLSLLGCDAEAHHLNEHNELSIFQELAHKKSAGSIHSERVVFFTTFGKHSAMSCVDPVLCNLALHISLQLQQYSLTPVIMVEEAGLAEGMQEYGAREVYVNGYKFGQGKDLAGLKNPSGAVVTKYFLALRLLQHKFTAFFMDWDVVLFQSPLTLETIDYDLMGGSDITSYAESDEWTAIIAAGREEVKSDDAMELYRAGMPLVPRSAFATSEGVVKQSTGFWTAKPTPEVREFLARVMRMSKDEWEQHIWDTKLKEHLLGVAGWRKPIRYGLFDLLEVLNYPKYEVLRNVSAGVEPLIKTLHFGNVHGLQKVEKMKENGWYKGESDKPVPQFEGRC